MTGPTAPRAHAPMTTVVFDTETTGFPRVRNARPSDLEAFEGARLIELGYVVLDERLREIKRVSHLVRTVDAVPNTEIHGIRSEDVVERGRDPVEVLLEFEADIRTAIALVAHNMKYDVAVLRSETYRDPRLASLRALLRVKRLVCTMMSGAGYMQGGKWPRLVELHTRLFGECPPQTHRALDDVDLCAACYRAMV